MWKKKHVKKALKSVPKNCKKKLQKKCAKMCKNCQKVWEKKVLKRDWNNFFLNLVLVFDIRLSDFKRGRRFGEYMYIPGYLVTGTYKNFNKQTTPFCMFTNRAATPQMWRKNIALGINKRLSSNCSSKELFKESTPIVQ